MRHAPSAFAMFVRQTIPFLAICAACTSSVCQAQIGNVSYADMFEANNELRSSVWMLHDNISDAGTPRDLDHKKTAIENAHKYLKRARKAANRLRDGINLLEKEGRWQKTVTIFKSRLEKYEDQLRKAETQLSKIDPRPVAKPPGKSPSPKSRRKSRPASPPAVTRRTTVRRVGETRSFRVKIQLFNAPSVSVANPKVASAWYDAERSRLYIKGVGEGVTQIDFKGKIRQLVAGTNTPIEQPVSFHVQISVTVRGRLVRERTRSIRLSAIKPGKQRSFPAKVFLGTRHRNAIVERIEGEGIVAATFNETKSGPKVILKGLGPGQAKVILRCERWDFTYRDWVRYTCTLKVTVLEKDSGKRPAGKSVEDAVDKPGVFGLPVRIELSPILKSPKPADAVSGNQSENIFGSTDQLDASLVGRVYRLKPGTAKLPDFARVTPVGQPIFVTSINVAERSYRSGFPGVTNLYEWFAIEYKGTFEVKTPGTYTFRLNSDDGSKLLIDGGKTFTLDNDGVHGTASTSGSVYLDKKVHTITIQYFQGPAYHVALQLFYKYEKGKEAAFPGNHFGLTTPKNPAAAVVKLVPVLVKNEDENAPWMLRLKVVYASKIDVSRLDKEHAARLSREFESLGKSLRTWRKTLTEAEKEKLIRDGLMSLPIKQPFLALTHWKANPVLPEAYVGYNAVPKKAAPDKRAALPANLPWLFLIGGIAAAATGLVLAGRHGWNRWKRVRQIS